MKLATLKTGTRDGKLVLVKRDLSCWTSAEKVAPTLQVALDDWETVAPRLKALAHHLERDGVPTEPFDATRLHAPLPRAYEWVDGSAYLNHVRLVRKARHADVPASLTTDPLVYQGGSSDFTGPTGDIVLRDEAWGADFEGEVAVVLGDTRMGTTPDEAEGVIRLVMLANDVSLRNLIPAELAKNFGFFQSKPATAFSPVAVTPDELGAAWRDGRVHLKLQVWLNDAQVGDCEAGPEMHFGFHELIAHIARTRNFCPGTILGSGTVSNADRARGISCLAELRTLETLDHGQPRTPFLKAGDRVRIEMHDADGHSVFGALEQTVRVTE